MFDLIEAIRQIEEEFGDRASIAMIVHKNHYELRIQRLTDGELNTWSGALSKEELKHANFDIMTSLMERAIKDMKEPAS